MECHDFSCITLDTKQEVEFQGTHQFKRLMMGQNENQNEAKDNLVSGNEIQRSLRKEILQLEDCLNDQFSLRCSLEKAMGFGSALLGTSSDSSMPKHVKELIREIAVLESEVMHLEHHLLSLYRKACDKQNIIVSDDTMELEHKLTPRSQEVLSLKDSPTNCNPNRQRPGDDHSHKQLMLPKRLATDGSSITSCSKKLNGSSVCRSHSELSQRSNVTWCSEKLIGDKTHRSHSVTTTPNRLSEDLVRCMGSIYCRLVEPPMVCPSVSSSTATMISSSSSSSSSFSSTSAAYSPLFSGDTWSPMCRKGYISGGTENPYHVQGVRDIDGPYSAVMELHSFCTDVQGVGDNDDLLRKFKSIIQRLEKIDVKNMNNEEKLAFWINIHNALVMHAYINYGIPQHSLRRSQLQIKARCNIGGRIVSAATIQSSILRHNSHRPRQWIRALVSPRLKLKGDDWQAYAIEHPQPLLHFALCSGNHSDPAVRIYSPKRVFQQMETGKEEYIRAAVGVNKEHKIILPKILESFAKDSSLSTTEMIDMIQLYVPENLRVAIHRCQAGGSPNCIEWIPYNFDFRYLILMSRELLSPMSC